MSELCQCDVCGAKVTALRRGRCAACYIRWAEQKPVGIGARCVICGERRRESLHMVEYQSSWHPMCHNCSSRAFQLEPLPKTVEAMREKLIRDRRYKERRLGGKDKRSYPIERRATLRRAIGADAWFDDWLDATELIVEMSALEMAEAADEATRIVMRPLN